MKKPRIRISWDGTVRGVVAVDEEWIGENMFNVTVLRLWIEHLEGLQNDQR